MVEYLSLIKSGVLFLFLSLFGVLPVHAQFKVDKWSDSEGLSNSYIYDIIQTSDGFMWIATDGGLFRFDGVRFKEFTKANTQIFKSNRFKVLHEDRQGVLWIGTLGGGFYSYKDSEFNQINKEDDVNDNIILSATEDSTGHMWFGTDGQGLIEVQENNFLRHNMQTWVPSNNIIGLGTTKAGNLLIGGLRTGLFIRNESPDKYYVSENNFQFDVIFQFTYLPTGELLFTTNNGIFLFDEGPAGHIPMSELPAGSKVVRDALFDSKGRFWVVTEVGTYFSNSFENLKWETVKGLPNIMTTTIIEDTEHNIWIGSQGLGLFRVSDSPFTNIGLEDGIASETVNAVTVTSNGDIYIGSESGVDKISGGKVKNFGMVDGLSGNSVNSLITDQYDVVWGGVFSRGIFSLKDDEITMYEPQDLEKEVAIKGIYSVYEVPDGNGLYLGTNRSGIQLWKEETVKQWNHREGLSNSHVHAITIDQNGTIWAATNYAVNKITGDSVKVYGFDQGLKEPLIVSLYSDNDSENSIWLGSHGGGLFRFQNEEFFQFNDENSFPIDAVLQIIEDNYGFFWMTSDHGLFRFNKQELHDFANGKLDFFSYDQYTKNDGLLTNAFTGLVQPTAHKDKHGLLYFATMAGVIKVNPGKIVQNQTSPKVYIDEISVDFEPVFFNEQLALSPDKQSFEISYTALNFTAPEQLTFKYKLENFDQDWIEAGNRRTAFYTNISPGEYTFKVQAQNSEGVWSETQAILPVTIMAAYYETLWFKIGIILVGVALITGFFQYRLTNIKRILNMRMQIANDLHDEIGSNISSVILKSRMLEGKEHSADYYAQGLRDIQSISLKTSQAMREIIWLINPRHDAIEDQVLQLRDISLSMLEGIETEIHSNLDFETIKLNPQVRRNLLLIYKEVLHNIVKHAAATKVSIYFAKEEKDYILRITDNGKGFELENQMDGKHYGLISLKERAKAMKGRLVINTAPGKGTEVFLRFKNYGSS